MESTKKRILKASRNLFNAQGYSNISIRMIAKGANMSVGNLNYHFRKKNDILEALYFEMISYLDLRLDELNQKNINLSYLLNGTLLNKRKMIEYRFFWVDLFFLLSNSPKIKKHFDARLSKRKEGYAYIFEKLIEKKLMVNIKKKIELTYLTSHLINFGNTWLYSSVLNYQIKDVQNHIRQQSFLMLSILLPYLTNKGKREFYGLFSERVKNKALM
ncbi:MAG: TetR family transcriptional regulator [Bacteroidota bacterium]